MTRLISLTRGLSAIVDEADYAALSKRKWYADKGRNGVWYARSDFGRKMLAGNTVSTGTRLYMHRAILTPEKPYFVDHIDGDGLNNCRSNLRLATSSQNEGNSKKNGAKTSSVFKGVTKNTSRGKPWLAQIMVARKHYHLGLFNSEAEAVVAYNKAAEKHFGQFALLNVISCR